jgi:thioredoxin 2
MAMGANAAAEAATIRICPCCGAKNRVRAQRGGETPRCGRCHADLSNAATAPSAPDHPVTVTEASFRAEVEQSNLPVLVDFWAPWCGPCRLVAPMLEQLARERAGRLKIAKVNVDENRALQARFGVQAIPTLALFRGGRLVDEVRGAVPKPELERRLARHGL